MGPKQTYTLMKWQQWVQALLGLLTIAVPFIGLSGALLHGPSLSLVLQW
jgi:hypothetical protein